MPKLWYYRLRGSGNAMGPVEAPNQTAARAAIRQFLGCDKRLPPGTDVWETTRENIRWIVDSNRAAGFGAAMGC